MQKFFKPEKSTVKNPKEGIIICGSSGERGNRRSKKYSDNDIETHKNSKKFQHSQNKRSKSTIGKATSLIENHTRKGNNTKNSNLSDEKHINWKKVNRSDKMVTESTNLSRKNTDETRIVSKHDNTKNSIPYLMLADDSPDKPQNLIYQISRNGLNQRDQQLRCDTKKNLDVSKQKLSIQKNRSKSAIRSPPVKYNKSPKTIKVPIMVHSTTQTETEFFDYTELTKQLHTNQKQNEICMKTECMKKQIQLGKIDAAQMNELLDEIEKIHSASKSIECFNTNITNFVTDIFNISNSMQRLTEINQKITDTPKKDFQMIVEKSSGNIIQKSDNAICNELDSQNEDFCEEIFDTKPKNLVVSETKNVKLQESYEDCFIEENNAKSNPQKTSLESGSENSENLVITPINLRKMNYHKSWPNLVVLIIKT